MQAFEATRCAYWFCLVSFLWMYQPILKVRSGINWYKQEEISHFRWLTTANGYLQMLLFHSSDLTTVEKTKLSKACVIYCFRIFAFISDDTP